MPTHTPSGWVMLRYQALLKEHHDELAKIVSSELGKTFEDAKGDVWRGIEVVEHACNVPSLLMGETVENVARNIDTYSITRARSETGVSFQLAKVSRALATACSICSALAQAISARVLVGAAREWIPEIRDALAKVRPGPWDDSGASYGPVINPQAKARIERLIGQGVEEGAQLLLDGRGYKVEVPLP